MAFLTINGARVLEGILNLPRVGPWHADLMVDAQSNLVASGPAQLSFADSGQAFTGTIIRQGVFADFLRMRVVAGAGALYKSTTNPKSYRQVPLKFPLTDILAAAGETLSTAADPSVLSMNLNRWTVVQQGCIPAMRSLLSIPGAVWRSLADGSIWTGFESWPVVDNSFSYVYERTDNSAGKVVIAADAPQLQPGTSFLGHQISQVQHVIEPSSFRTVAFFEV